MYKSPISIYETAMETIIEQRENAIFAKVQDAFDVQVDKEELIRALKYDRDQYNRGYKDGKREAYAHGYWTIIDENCCVCSVCHKHSIQGYYYCPECGAMMDGGEDE